MSPQISNGSMTPVDALAPNTMTMIGMAIMLRPATPILVVPRSKAAQTTQPQFAAVNSNIKTPRVGEVREEGHKRNRFSTCAR